MLFNWDSVKAEANLKKHGVSFEMAQTVFDDPFHLSVVDSKKNQEERWITIGQSADGQPLVVVHLYCCDQEGSEMIRIISARKATRKEKKQYEKGV